MTQPNQYEDKEQNLSVQLQELTSKYNINDRDFIEILQLIAQTQLQAKAEENRYHWHHQKQIEQCAKDGVVSSYFLEREAELTKQKDAQ